MDDGLYAESRRAQTTGSLNILSAIFLWSSLGLLVRTADVAPLQIILYSSFFSVAAQGLFIMLRGSGWGLTDVAGLKYPFILALVGLVNTGSYYYAFQHTSIANSVLTHYTAPVFTAFLAPVFLKERMSLRIVASIITASAGLFLMLNGVSLTGGHLPGILAGLLSGLGYAGCVILGRLFTQGMKPLYLNFYVNLAICAYLLPFIDPIPMKALMITALMGLVHSTFAPILYYRGLRVVAANRAAVLGYLEPVCAIMLGALLLGEAPAAVSMLGGAIIVFSGWLTMKGG